MEVLFFAVPLILLVIVTWCSYVVGARLHRSGLHNYRYGRLWQIVLSLAVFALLALIILYFIDRNLRFER